MKIDITKEEWEFLHYQFSNCEMLAFDIKNDFDVCENISQKLGSEWIDEAEEMRKFREGFAYKPKKWLFDDEKVKDEI